MRTFIIAVFIGVVALAVAEDCFDKSKTAQWKPMKMQCMEDFPSTTESRHKKIIVCVMKKMGMLNTDAKGDAELDYIKFRTTMDEVKARDLNHIIEEMDKTWNDSNHDEATFFDAWFPRMMELCPDCQDWFKDM